MTRLPLALLAIVVGFWLGEGSTLPGGGEAAGMATAALHTHLEQATERAGECVEWYGEIVVCRSEWQGVLP